MKSRRQVEQETEEELRRILDDSRGYPDGVEVLDWEDLRKGKRTKIKKELLGKKGFEICNRDITKTFIKETITNDISGKILRSNGVSFGFVFWEEFNGEKHIELICIKKPPNKFKGFRFGKKLIDDLFKKPNTKKITLSAVEDAIDFYLGLGFTIDSEEEDEEGLVEMTLLKTTFLGLIASYFGDFFFGD